MTDDVMDSSNGVRLPATGEHGAAVTAAVSPPAQVRRRVVIVSVLLGLAGVAWVVSANRMSGMQAGPGASSGDLGSFLTDWLVMMAAMMLAAVAPAIAGTAASIRMTTVLVAGYLAVWCAVGLVAYGVLRAGGALGGTTFTWDHAGRGLVVAVLVTAAGYQLSGFKRDYLRRCSGPLSTASLLGPGAALQAGCRFGAWCVACSWALMASLVALGAMNLTWMVLFAALIAAERLLPRAAQARVAVAAVLVALAVGIALAPASVPGLTLPDDGPTMRM